jgi:glutamate 5-kinase
MHKPVLVIKLGSAVITGNNGLIDRSVISKVATEIAKLSEIYRVVLVSSGAVGSGKLSIRNYKGTLIQRKAAASVGNPILIQSYHKYFSRFGLTVAQALCERHHFSNRMQFLQLKETFHEFWENSIIPVVNENDLVSDIELKFSDNDELATLIAIGFDAETMILCTSVGGLLDAEKKIVPTVKKIDSDILSFVTDDKTNLGLGGMISKLTFSKLANSLGIRVIICGLKGISPLQTALKGTKGTTFIPQQSNLKARQKWLASGSITLGGIHVDKGAEKALQSRKSLLTVGVTKVQGKFSAGEVVQLLNPEESIIGVAKVKMAATELADNIKVKNALAAHADDIVMF